MALIKCLECEKEISDAARACPNCGYESRKTEDIEPIVQKTELGELEKNIGAGIAMFVVGFVFIPISIVIMPFGLVLLIPAILLMVYGGAKISGTRSAVCPYCKNESVLNSKTSTNFKCSNCKKLSIVKDSFLEIVE